MRRSLWTAVFGLATFIVGTFLVVFDELYTLALYCRNNWSEGFLYVNTCRYPYPIGPPLDAYTAFEVAYGIVVLFGMLALIAFHKALNGKESQ